MDTVFNPHEYLAGMRKHQKNWTKAQNNPSTANVDLVINQKPLTNDPAVDLPPKGRVFLTIEDIRHVANLKISSDDKIIDWDAYALNQIPPEVEIRYTWFFGTVKGFGGIFELVAAFNPSDRDAVTPVLI